MGDFMRASGLTDQPAAKLREILRSYGLVAVEETPIRGAAVNMRLALTPFGREVAKHLSAAAEALARGPPKARR